MIGKPVLRRRLGFVLWLTVLFVARFLVTDMAVAGQQDASIIGVVTDEGGGVLPGVTITAKSPALQVPAVTAVTDVRGEYRMTPLPVGTFSLEYTLAGFQTVRREGIILTVSFVAKVDMQMKVGSLSESITVTGASPIVDMSATSGNATQLTAATLEAIPTSRNGTIAIMNMAAGTRQQIDVGGDQITTPPIFHAFGLDNQPWQVIEGVVVSASKSGTQGGIYWDFPNLQEVKVSSVGNPAEDPTRGIYINAIVKSGGNQFHGDGFFAGTNSTFNSSNIDSALTAQGVSSGDKLIERKDYSGDLGGRVIPNKLWFYTDVRRRTQYSNTFGCLQPGAGQPQTTLHPDGPPCFGTDDQIFNTEKLSWQMNASQRVIAFYTYARKVTQGSVNRFTDWDNRNGQRLPSHVGKVEWTKVHGNALVMSLGYYEMHWYSRFRGYGYGIPLYTDLVTGRTGGMSASDGEDPDDYRHQVRGSLSWYKPDWLHGNHTIKVGAEFMRDRSDRMKTSRANTTSAAAEINLGYVPPSYDSGNYEMVYRNAVPFELFVFNYPVRPYDLEDYFGSYVQDDWTMGKLTLNLGARYAWDLGFAPPQCRAVADAPGDVANPAQCFPLVQLPAWGSVAPRLHAAYNLSGDGKTVIKGGWGRFMYMRYTDQVMVVNHDQFNQTVYLWHAPVGTTVYSPGQVNLDPNGPDYVSTSQTGGGSATSNGIANPNEKQPGTDELSASLERELVPNLAVRITGIYSRTFETQRILNTLRPPSVYTIPITDPVPNPNGIGTTGSTLTYYAYPQAYAGAKNLLPTFINDSAANSSFRSAELAVTKRLANRWQLQASYSITKKHIPLVPNAGTVTGTTLYINTYDPNSQINNYDFTTEWLARIQGSYLLPFDLNLAAHYEHRSGNPLQRTAIFSGPGTTIPSITLPTEPLGSIYKLPSISLLDLSLDKTLTIMGRRASVGVNVYNALNANTITAQSMASGPTFGLATAILLPRLAELHVSYKF